MLMAAHTRVSGEVASLIIKEGNDDDEEETTNDRHGRGELSGLPYSQRAEWLRTIYNDFHSVSRHVEQDRRMSNDKQRQ